MKAQRIICVGNRFVEADALGGLVFDYLRRHAPPASVQVFDGGLAGLDLLRLVEGAGRVVFVDSMANVEVPGEIIVLDEAGLREIAPDAYDHGAGLPYLVRALPYVCDDPMPELLLVAARTPCQPETVRKAADLAIEIALQGWRAEVAAREEA